MSADKMEREIWQMSNVKMLLPSKELISLGILTSVQTGKNLIQMGKNALFRSSNQRKREKCTRSVSVIQKSLQHQQNLPKEEVCFYLLKYINYDANGSKVTLITLLQKESFFFFNQLQFCSFCLKTLVSLHLLLLFLYLPGCRRWCWIGSHILNPGTWLWKGRHAAGEGRAGLQK